jgi:hypothetical protein
MLSIFPCVAENSCLLSKSCWSFICPVIINFADSGKVTFYPHQIGRNTILKLPGVDEELGNINWYNNIAELFEYCLV